MIDDVASKPGQIGRPALLNCLWKFQKEKGYISDSDVKDCAAKLGLAKVEVEGVLSFYHFFSRKPRGEFIVYLNTSIVSHFRGYDRVRDAFEKETGSVFNDPDVTDRFGLFDTPCIGLTDQEPSALINYYPFTNLNTFKIKKIIAALRKGAKVEDLCDTVEDNIRFLLPNDKAIILRDYHPGIMLDGLMDMTRDEVIEEVIESGLRGMGGAFFSTGLKWKYCAEQRVSPKYIVCNADEGEPGTFKDRVLLNSYPGLVLEGMIAAGYAVGAEKGIIYLRGEYTWLLPKINNTIEYFEERHYLGKNVAGIEGFNFNIRVQLGAGSYVCGEETALLNSLEGKRGEPRTKQYFPTVRGYLDKPTIINNVETFCAAARVLQLGAKKFRSCGTENSPGTKLISVSGDCHMPGIYEIEWGMTVRDLLKLAKTDDPYFIQVSGPSGECISGKDIDRKISLDDLKCGGSFMIFNSDRNLVKILTNFAEFFKRESCGVCTPCRAGNFLIRRKLKKMEFGLARTQDLDEIIEWGEIMRRTSRCGLGKTATKSLCIALEKFSSDFNINHDENVKQFNRSFDLNDATREYELFNN